MIETFIDRWRWLLVCLMVGAGVLRTVSVAQQKDTVSLTQSVEAQVGTNMLYDVIQVALTPTMILIIGYFIRREIVRNQEAQDKLDTKQESDRERFQTQLLKQQEDSDRDREEIYKNMRADREQIKTAIDKVADALTAVSMRLVAIETAAQVRSPAPAPTKL